MKKKASTSVRQKPAATVKPRKRKRGRPQAIHGTVGQEAIVVAARRLVEEMLPHQVTIALIAREAGVDPALVRYYFTNREHLLLAVVESILADWTAHPPADETPAAQVSAHIANMLRFSRSVRSMQRLMLEECGEAKSPAVRNRLHALNVEAVQALAVLLRTDKDADERTLDALFMHVAMIGLAEFFAAAQSVILPLAPQGISPAELAVRYEKFVTELVLDGVRKNLRRADRKH